MDFEGAYTPKRRVAQLQLAPMIDVFTLIIVFLLKGAVFSETSISVPLDIKPPISSSVESSELAPQVFVGQDSFTFEIQNEKISVKKNQFMDDLDYRETIQAKIKKQFDGLSAKSKQALSNLNVVADAEVHYDFIFEVIKVFREVGFNSILFVAIGDSGK